MVTGLTNREVADRLYLSPHTVDSHLRHAFAKLDINSRVELAREAMIHDPAGPQPRAADVTRVAHDHVDT